MSGKTCLYGKDCSLLFTFISNFVTYSLIVECNALWEFSEGLCNTTYHWELLVIIIIIKDQTRQHIISIFNFHSFHLKMLLTAKVRFSFPYPKPAKSFQIYLIYLRRQQERGLMQKARRLMDENSVSFQMFLILLSYITFGSESQISVFKQCQSNT